MNWYYLNAANEVVGPHSEDSMEELRSSGTLNTDSLVCREGEESWTTFNKAFGSGSSSDDEDRSDAAGDQRPQRNASPEAGCVSVSSSEKLGTFGQATLTNRISRIARFAAVALIAGVAALFLIPRGDLGNLEDNPITRSSYEPKIVTNGEPSGEDLRKWRIAGIHLGMSKTQVVDAMEHSIDPSITLTKASGKAGGASYYTPEMKSADAGLKLALENSRFSFDSRDDLVAVRLDLEIIKRVSDLEVLPTKDFAQQIVRQFALQRLEIDHVPTGRSDVSHVVYEAAVREGDRSVLVTLTDIQQRTRYGARKSRMLRLALVEPLSFGPKGSLLGLKFGMGKAETLSVLRSRFGGKTKLKSSESWMNTELPKSLDAYDIYAGKSSLGTAERSFVVFAKDGGLCEVFFNSDELGAATSCNSYHTAVFGQEFMKHFDIDQMETTRRSSSIEYKYEHDGLIHKFTHSRFAGYTVYVLKREHRVKF